MYSQIKTDEAKATINDWMNKERFTHFFTVRSPLPAYTDNLDIARNHLYKIVKHFQRSLKGGHWNRNPIHFTGFAEQGESGIWHWHLLLLAEGYTTKQLREAVRKTTKCLRLSEYTLDIRPINRRPENLNGYCLKEVRVSNNGHFHNDRVITSEILFNLPIRKENQQ